MLVTVPCQLDLVERFFSSIWSTWEAPFAYLALLPNADNFQFPANRTMAFQAFLTSFYKLFFSI